MKKYLFIFLILSFSLFAQEYPSEWFQEFPRGQAESWEVLPQDAGTGEVILSKRTELGIFSNFGATPFVIDGKKFASVEGLWQSMKYPDPTIEKDERLKADWPFTRAEVEQMTAFDAKHAGDEANKIYTKYGFKNISYGEKFFNYKDRAEGSQIHLMIIRKALRAKLDQNEGLWPLLLRTGCLKLLPDHKVNENDPPSYKYYSIFMELRREKQFVPCENN
jgi:predicted NAD-dependent protein-ADP-ribosyltransferase YbiA (DUF1768 family)